MGINKNGPCKLCGKNAKLIKQSHIIPEFMYQDLYDESRRMLFLNMQQEDVRPRPVQTGFYDKYILCERCESVLLSSLERYASRVLYGGSPTGDERVRLVKTDEGIDALEIENLDFKMFKLFLLSIVWRAHISENKYFKHVVLSKPIADRLKNMLLTDNAGEAWEFRISIAGCKGMSGELANIGINPGMFGAPLNTVHFAIGGFIYFIEMTPGSDFLLFKEYTLTVGRPFKIPIFSGNDAYQLLTAFGVRGDVAHYYAFHPLAGKTAPENSASAKADI